MCEDGIAIGTQHRNEATASSAKATLGGSPNTLPTWPVRCSGASVLRSSGAGRRNTMASGTTSPTTTTPKPSMVWRQP